MFAPFSGRLSREKQGRGCLCAGKSDLEDSPFHLSL